MNEPATGTSPPSSVREALASCARDFMRVTPLRAIIAIAFVALCSHLSVDRTRAYYGRFTMPPSFRHMDPTIFYPVIADYLDGQRVSGDTLLVLGDCVAFGHGVQNSFSSFLDVPGMRVVNVSMQSFKYDLMVRTVEEAARRGVKRVLIQLHPFEDYGFEARLWQQLSARHPASGEILAAVESNSPIRADADFARQAAVNWRLLSVTIRSNRLSFHEIPPDDLAIWFSGILRYDILGRLPLSRNRFAIDDWIGTHLSYYAARTMRSDSFVDQLPERRQIEILKEQRSFWPNFVIDDPDIYRKRALRYSAPVRLARTAKALGVEPIFFMAPTLTRLISANTVIRRSDLRLVSDTMREAVTSQGFRYFDFLENDELEREMIHYDNLTAQGQKLLARLLNDQLTQALKAEQSTTAVAGQ